MVIYLSCSAPKAVFDYFGELGYEIRRIEPSGSVNGAIASHPDIFMCRDTVRGVTIHGDMAKIGRDYSCPVFMLE